MTRWGRIVVIIAVMTQNRFKDRYWVKAAKWYAYKRFTGTPKWKTRFLFDRAVRALGPGDVVIDCGANIGEFTGVFLSTGATVHAFEPDPWTFEQLRKNYSGIDELHLYPQAVSVAAGEAALYRRADFAECPEIASVSASLCVEKSNVDPECSVPVEKISLVGFIRGLDRRVALLKVDIEGAEVEVLEHLLDDGCLQLCDRVFVETHDDRIPSLKERTDRLRDLTRGELEGRLFLDWQ